MFPELGFWQPCRDADLRALAIVVRHYPEALKRRRHGQRGGRGFCGPAEKMVLLGPNCDALWVWLRPSLVRLDGQTGVACTVFRNESSELSSVLVREADTLADQRWPGLRHWTYVDPVATARRRGRSSPPGRCFVEAGWTLLEQTSTRGLRILERC